MLKRFGLPSLLLVMVFATHYVPDLIGGFYPEREIAAAKAWQLVFRGFEAMLLYLIVWSLIPYRPLKIRLTGSAMCAWGAFESVQIPLCRLSFEMTRPPSKDSRLYTGLCDIVTGVPAYMLTLLALLLIFAVLYTKNQ